MPEFVLKGRDRAARELDAFTLGYVEALFFTESSPAFNVDEWFDDERREATDAGRADGDIPGDVGVADLHPDSLASIVADCERFQRENAELLASAYGIIPDRRGATPYDESSGGRDFWYSRNGHGVGYWDRDLGEVGDRLHDAAKAFGESDVWFGEHVDYGNLHWVYVDGARGKPGPAIMPARQAWGYAATWGSMMTSGDPGACMYGFDERCLPQSEEHRRDVLAWISDCRTAVIAKPSDYDSDELQKLDSFVRYIKQAPIEESAQ